MRHVDQHILRAGHRHQIVGAANVVELAVLRVDFRQRLARRTSRGPIHRVREQQVRVAADQLRGYIAERIGTTE